MPNYEFSDHPKRIEKSILIQASPAKIWEYLTNPDLMKHWMGDPEMKIEVFTDWKVGSPFTIKGFHHQQFENKGTILQLEAEKVFQYSYLSSLSNLDDTSENHTIITFTLVQKEEEAKLPKTKASSGKDEKPKEQLKTELTVEVENFPTEVIYKHLEFYWNGTMHLLKQAIQNISSKTL